MCGVINTRWIENQGNLCNVAWFAQFQRPNFGSRWISTVCMSLGSHLHCHIFSTLKSTESFDDHSKSICRNHENHSKF
jgi:hypothetical protein